MLNVITGVLDIPTPPVTNAYESIATVTVGSGGSATITFSSIPSTYKHLQIRAMNLTGTATNDIKMRFNSDSATNYSWHQLQGSGSVAAAAGNVNQTYMGAGMAGGSANPGVSIVDILEYGNTNTYKTTRTLWGYDANGSGHVGIWSGSWRSTSAVTTIALTSDSGNFNQYSSFALYGIKG